MMAGFLIAANEQLGKVPPLAWGAAAVLVVWWFAAGPKTRHADAPASGYGDEDIRVGAYADRPGFDPFVPCHAPGWPYILGGMVNHEIREGRRKEYPAHTGGVFAMLTNPDPQDDDMYPWVTYGGRR